MSQPTYCQCTHCGRESHPVWARKYDELCLDCHNAGVGDFLDRIAALESELAAYKDTTPVTFAEVEDVIMENVSTAKIHRNQSDGSFTVTNCRVVIRTRADLAAVRRAVR